MVFQPAGWFIGWVCGKLADKALKHLISDKDLGPKLDKAVADWAKSLPKDKYVNPAALFPDVASLTAEDRPKYYALQQTLSDNKLPSKKDWHEVFMESWLCIRKNVSKPQPFFELSEQEADKELIKLAQAAYEVCKQNKEIFQSHVIDKLEVIEEDVKYLRKHLPDKSKILEESRQIHNLPYTSIGDLLKGRDGAMKKLDSRLSHNKTKVAAITQVQAVHGLGGVGKTRLAVEYAWFALQNKKYNAAFFVIADTESALNSNLAALAAQNRLNLPQQNEPNQFLVVNAVLGHLASRNDWLLIFDNVDDQSARDYLNKILPSLSSGRVLITSRMSNWPATIADIELAKLDEKSAVDYLLQKTQDKRTKTNDDKTIAANLAQKLDGLPIALEQAAAYISQRHISFQTYLNEFESSRKEILSWHKSELTNYPTPVLAVWQSSEKQLSAPARAILRLSSLLSPEPIPVVLFESASEKISEAASLLSFPRKRESSRAGFTPPKSKFDIRSILAELAGYSLIKLTESSFTIHRLVQDSIRLSIPEKSLKLLTQIILDIVNVHLPTESPQDIRSWYIYKLLDPHLSLLLSLADKLDILKPTSRIMNEFGLYLKTLARFKQAESLYNRAHQIDEKLFSPDHPEVATHLNNLAGLFMATNRFPEAEPLMRRALEIDEKSLDIDHPSVARDLSNLAQILKDTNRFKEAEPLMRRALEIDENSSGSDHHNVAIDMNNLAQLLQATNRLKEAEPLMRRVVEICKKSLGVEHPNVATAALGNLALLLKATNRLTEAEPLMKRALKIFEDSLGHDHPYTKGARQNLQILKSPPAP
jgi:tetratricopeptide (TPR) repeat protein